MKAKEIRNFLSSLTDIDFEYLEIQTRMARDSRIIIRQFNVSKKRFCELLKISEKQYQTFLNGGFNYDLKKMALLHNAYVILHKEQAEINSKKELVSVIDVNSTSC